MNDDLISRKAAIDALDHMDYMPGEWAVKGLTMCKEIIKGLPSAQPETHEKRTKTHACDCISRQDAIDAHYEYCNKHPDAGFPVWSLKILEDLPSAQPDMSEYSDKLWRNAYERGRAEAQAEIVRCKDCIFHGFCRTSPKWAVAPKDDWYCADAERRTDD